MADIQSNWILNLTDKISGPLRTLQNYIRNLDKSTQAVDKKFKVLPKSLDQLKTQLQRLEAGKNNPFRTDHIDRYNRMIAETRRQMQLLNGTQGSNSFGNNLQSNIAAMGHFVQMVGNLGNQFREATRPGLDLNHALMELKAITDADSATIEKIEADARRMAKTFGIEAAGSVESFKIFLSKLGPDLAKTPDILSKMGENAALMSKQLKGDTLGAAESLSTAMNQFGVSIKDPAKALAEMTRMMDLMSKAGQDGAMELPQIKDAVAVVGAEAKRAGWNFGELNAAIQIVGQYADKKGAEGGTVLRNLIADFDTLSIKSPDVVAALKHYGVSIEKMADPTVSAVEKLKEMKKAMHDKTLMSKTFEVFDKSSAMALMEHIDVFEGYTESAKKADGTTKAMADTIMTSRKEGIARFTSAFQDLGISISNVVGDFTPFLEAGFKGIEVMGNMGGAMMGMQMIGKTKLGAMLAGLTTKFGGFFEMIKTGALTVGTAFVTMAETIWAAMMTNPIGWILGIVAALVALGTYLYNTSETFRGVMWGIWAVLKEVGKRIYDHFMGLGKVFIGVFTFDWATMKEGSTQFYSSFEGLKEGIAKSFREGREKGIEDFWKEEAQGEGEATGDFAFVTTGNGTVVPGAQGTGTGTNPNLFDWNKKKGHGGSGSGDGIGGGGGGSAKTITLNITMNQQFKVAENVKKSMDEIRSMVAQVMRDVANDVVIQTL